MQFEIEPTKQGSRGQVHLRPCETVFKSQHCVQRLLVSCSLHAEAISGSFGEWKEILVQLSFLVKPSFGDEARWVCKCSLIPKEGVEAEADWGLERTSVSNSYVVQTS